MSRGGGKTLHEMLAAVVDRDGARRQPGSVGWWLGQRSRPGDGFVLALGLLLGCGAWLVLACSLLLRGRPIPWFLLWYNIPITLVFGAMAVHGVTAFVRLGVRRFIVDYAGVLVAWGLGGLVLYWRLVTHSTDVSGHMTWAVLLAVQCLLQRLPLWFTACVWGIVVQVLALKLLVLGGTSGQKGLIAGAALAALLWGISAVVARTRGAAQA